ncbi:MAG: glycosyl hydrolase 53 family protein [Deltaproteobacteria bacterium]|nr:glycosyl hydrolase 53 family protein [Deltaproteobacteria bacterium]
MKLEGLRTSLWLLIAASVSTWYCSTAGGASTADSGDSAGIGVTAAGSTVATVGTGSVEQRSEGTTRGSGGETVDSEDATAGSGGTTGDSGGESGGSGGTTGGSGGESGGSGGTTGGSGGITADSGDASSGSAADFPFILGADISSAQESNLSFQDTDGQTKTIFDLLKNHGFNYIRLRTFVDPMAPYGYASSANGCSGRYEAFGDKNHVVAYGQRVKAAGMGFLLDFHYSDVWADPDKQIVPDAWRSASSITDLATILKAYTKDVLTTALDAGARPDMVQVGNEITPGMLMHVPGPNTDCWGNNPENAPIGGSTSSWDNLATLLIAGIEGVREVDPTIRTVLHIENTEDLSGVKWWIDRARSRGVEFDVLGLSCYTVWQETPSVWENTFTDLAAIYPDLAFIIAEYNPERTRANLIMKNLPDGRGLGTFFWEPTLGGKWGSALFSRQGNTFVANSADFSEFDAMLPLLGLRGVLAEN